MSLGHYKKWILILTINWRHFIDKVIDYRNFGQQLVILFHMWNCLKVKIDKFDNQKVNYIIQILLYGMDILDNGQLLKEWMQIKKKKINWLYAINQII